MSSSKPILFNLSDEAKLIYLKKEIEEAKKEMIAFRKRKQKGKSLPVITYGNFVINFD